MGAKATSRARAPRGGNASACDRAVDAGGMPAGPSFTVHRVDVLRDMVRQAREAGIVLVVAPDGFGKTALLLQYVDEIVRDPRRGSARIFDAAGRSYRETLDFLDACAQELPPMTRPLLAIDNLPDGDNGELEVFVARLRSLRDTGFELLVATRPAHRTIRALLPDAVKIGAQALMVRPREYAAWVATLSIARTLDVYGLTQGIPSLVAALSATVQQVDGVPSLLDVSIDALYRGVLDDLRNEAKALMRVTGMMLLMGQGSMDDVERGGVRIERGELVRLTRDYPVFGYEVSTRRFSCLGSGGQALDGVRAVAAAQWPELVSKAARALVKAARVDEAVELIARLGTGGAARDLTVRFPVQLVCAGYAQWMVEALCDGAATGAVAVRNLVDADGAPRSLLALYAAMLTLGDLKGARAAAAELAELRDRIGEEVTAAEWGCMRALASIWEPCPGIGLSRIAFARSSRTAHPATACFQAYMAARSRLVRGDVEPAPARQQRGETPWVDEVDLPALFTRCAVLIDELWDGTMTEPDARDAALEAAVPVLRARGLAPVSVIVRAVLAARRLFAGFQETDERAFSDAGTMAVRMSDHDAQLVCLALEGWRELAANQAVNAQFRAQQVLKLAEVMEGSTPGYRAWAALLERAAHLKGASKLAACEEAELLDLTARSCDASEAWAVALTLATARYDAELAAWCSLHKGELFQPSFRLPARLALAALGERADALRRLIPDELRLDYTLGERAAVIAGPHFELLDGTVPSEYGQICINLFGGFRVMRNGHVISDRLWRRRKTSVLAARLVLAMGALVNRQVIAQEFWPDCDYAHARNNLYSSITSLRKAMGMGCADGPTYLVMQSDGLAVNVEYVVSDVMQFDAVAREVLLRRSGLSAPQVIEACLKLEQLYVGQLYVPDSVDIAFFTRMRDVFQVKFTDCMLCGIDAALDEGDLAAASWLVDAALRFDAQREDVLRAAVRVLDLSGRRREVIGLYRDDRVQGLEQSSGEVAEQDARKLYRDLLGAPRAYGVM